MVATALNRCPRCGNDNREDSYVCAFCGKRLRFERIENFWIFKRIEAEWQSPDKWYKQLLWLFIKPNKAFWSINHKRKKAPGYYILLLNTLLFGLMGLAFFSHFIINSPSVFLYSMSFFVAFLLFGLAYYFIFGFVLIWLFSKGANYAVNFSERLESRFGGTEDEMEKYSETEMSPFSIYKGGTLHQQQAYKYKMMFCAFAPFLLTSIIQIIIILGAFPTVFLNVNLPFNPIILDAFFNSPTWTVLYLIDALVIAIWVPLLISIAIRELSNSSTTRVLVSSISIGIIIAVIFYFLRPTFGF
ncbi:MAG: zinc ribbon domain-containing protein [Candidatus Lokiarchaeota archaeon]|jgi:hypothetical protein